MISVFCRFAEPQFADDAAVGQGFLHAPLHKLLRSERFICCDAAQLIVRGKALKKI
jgi:hypothetical protein